MAEDGWPICLLHPNGCSQCRVFGVAGQQAACSRPCRHSPCAGGPKIHHLSYSHLMRVIVVELFKSLPWSARPDVPQNMAYPACRALGSLLSGRALSKKLRQRWTTTLPGLGDNPSLPEPMLWEAAPVMVLEPSEGVKEFKTRCLCSKILGGC